MANTCNNNMNHCCGASIATDRPPADRYFLLLSLVLVLVIAISHNIYFYLLFLSSTTTR